jgi:hypothetical protein
MFLRRWRTRHLVASWIVYWILLLLGAAARPLLEYWRIQRTNGHGNVSFSLDLAHAAMWIAIPPLVLFVLWMLARDRDVPAGV